MEAPPGLKANLQRTLASWSADFAGGAGAPPLRAQLLLLLAWFHAVVQERRSYIPQARARAPTLATHLAARSASPLRRRAAER